MALTKVTYSMIKGASINVMDYGALGDGTTNDTSAINLAITAALAAGKAVYFPAGVYIVTPATVQSTTTATYNCAFKMQSNLHCFANRDATIKVSDNYSTDASPKEFAIFSTIETITNVSFIGLRFDLNGQNNSMSPSRPVTYNSYNHAAIMALGPTGIANYVWVEDCIFQNCAGVCYIATALVAATDSPALGINWTFKNNLFINGGLDASDHTSIYAMCDYALCEGNIFWADAPPNTVGLTGSSTAYEIHGSFHRFVNNTVQNFRLGVYVSGNFTTPSVDSIVSNNNFYTKMGGIFLYRGVNMLALEKMLISNNTFYFDNYTYSGAPLYKAAIALQGQLGYLHAVDDVKISGNHAVADYTGGLLSRFVHWDTITPTTTEVCHNLSITDNQIVGFTEGVYINTNSDNGQGFTEISRNQFIDMNPDILGNLPKGISINAVGTVTTLAITGNQFIDERVSPQLDMGIYLNSGVIGTLHWGDNLFKAASLTYKVNSVGGIAISGTAGTFTNSGVTAAVADGGTITHSTLMGGVYPPFASVTGSVAGEIVTVTSITVNTMVVGIKKNDGTVGTPQTVYWQVKY